MAEAGAELTPMREKVFRGTIMKNDARRGFLSRIARFLRDPRGVSAIEFAFVFPVMVLLYLGGTALTQGIVIKRKTTLVTSTVANIVSQYTNIATSDMTSIMGAAAAVIEPYDSSPLGVIVSSVQIDANGAATVKWSQATGTSTALTSGVAVTLPTGIGGIANANTSVIWAQGTYLYTLPLGSTVLGRTSMTFSQQFYLRPRRVSCITFNGATCP
jgi:Flp pilus assembly protein TadG